MASIAPSESAHESFCFTFLMFGLVLFIYEYFLNDPDTAPMDAVLGRFGALTDSQRRSPSSRCCRWCC